MRTYSIRFIDGSDETIQAERFRAANHNNLPHHYDFYEGNDLLRRVFIHALKEEPREIPSSADTIPPRATR